MNRLSITLASAALAAASLPLSGGCSKSPPSEQASGPPDHGAASQSAVAKLTPVAIPPSLQTISFDNDLFAPPPAPKFSGDAARAAEAAEAASRQIAAENAARSAAASGQEQGEAIEWTGSTKVGGSDTKKLSPLKFPAYDPRSLKGTDFDYQAGWNDAPVYAPSLTRAPPPAADDLVLPSTENLFGEASADAADAFAIAPPANAPVEHDIDSAWKPSGQSAYEATPYAPIVPPVANDVAPTEPLVTPLPTPLQNSGKNAHVTPMPQAAQQQAPQRFVPPSQRSVPELVDTRSWSQREPQPQGAALPYPSTEHSAAPPQPSSPPYAGRVDVPAVVPAEPVLTLPPVVVEPLNLPVSSGGDMNVVRHHAQMLIERGTELGERGALYSAKTDFLHALRLVAQSQDAAAGDRRHSEALARAWQALDEAEDFVPAGARPIDLQQVVSAHRTALLKDADLTRMTPLEATQKYFAYAQEQLALAGGDETVAAEALHCLGKTHVFIARESNEAARTHGPLALAMQQAALMVDERHDGAANELGVLLAKYGQWSDSRRVLLHAVSLRPTAEKWQNLAVVHEHLGEQKLAQLARQEAEIASMQRSQQAYMADPRVRWVSPDQFAQNGSPNTAIPQTGRRPAPPPSQKPAESSPNTAWKWPWLK